MQRESYFKTSMPPPVKNFLTPSQVTQLQQTLKESELAHVRERILIILLQNDGKTHQEISNFLVVHP
jgi:site-specific recombinase XerD